jgi:hypothetical protein
MLGLLAQLEILELQVMLEQMGRRVPQGLPEMQGQPEQREVPEMVARLGRLDQLAQLEQMGQREVLVLLEALDLPVQLDPQEMPDRRAQLEILELLVMQVPMVLQVLQE